MGNGGGTKKLHIKIKTEQNALRPGETRRFYGISDKFKMKEIEKLGGKM